MADELTNLLLGLTQIQPSQPLAATVPSPQNEAFSLIQSLMSQQNPVPDPTAPAPVDRTAPGVLQAVLQGALAGFQGRPVGQTAIQRRQAVNRQDAARQDQFNLAQFQQDESRRREKLGLARDDLSQARVDEREAQAIQREDLAIKRREELDLEKFRRNRSVSIQDTAAGSNVSLPQELVQRMDRGDPKAYNEALNMIAAEGRKQSASKPADRRELEGLALANGAANAFVTGLDQNGAPIAGVQSVKDRLVAGETVESILQDFEIQELDTLPISDETRQRARNRLELQILRIANSIEDAPQPESRPTPRPGAVIGVTSPPGGGEFTGGILGPNFTERREAGFPLPDALLRALGQLPQPELVRTTNK